MISGLHIEWTVGNAPAGEDVLERMSVAFERAGDNLTDFGKYVFPKLVPVFESELAGQFDARGRGPHAGAWAQLSERYAAWKALNYPGAGILERSGQLREALTNASSPMARRQISTDEFDFGTIGVEYASFHQSGTEFMVDRPPFDFGDDFERQVQAAAMQGVREAMQDAGANEFLSEGGP